MIPIRDSEPSRINPVIIKTIIAANALVFFYELSLGSRLQAFTMEYGLVPARYFSLASMGPQAYLGRFSPLVTHMFIHAGWLHIIFNMLFLWIFGDNIEDRLGKLRFVAFYLACGLSAAYLQLYMAKDSALPMVGASGAIAGVMGGYLILFPKARVLTVIPIFFFIQLVEVPAVVFLGFWFVLQFVSGTVTLLEGGGSMGGVAFWAHIGGFAAGVMLVRLMARPATAAEHGHSQGSGGHRDATTSDETFGGESW